MAETFRIGVDIGGTFTDVVAQDERGNIRFFKTPTTREDESIAVVQSVERLASEWGISPASISRFAHGTTVATNAVLERRGAKIGLITTRGFRDVLEIGRQMRHEMYRAILKSETPTFLAPGALRREVSERIAHDGSVLEVLSDEELLREAAALVDAGVEAIAICFLFSFANPQHEIRAGELIAKKYPDLSVVLSHEVDPQFREYERTVVTAFDAYVKPVINRYLGRLEAGLESKGVAAPLQVIQSRGGLMASSVARQRPVQLFLSGPAAGVIGAQRVGESAGVEDLITVDVGGTSSDIALIRKGEVLIRSEGYVDGYTVRVPMVDVNSIGSGGGSIAWLDAGNGLRVGPRSAGSKPGPACYGRGGDLPTVSDASVVLGYINPDNFAGGALTLKPELAREAIRKHVADRLGLSVEEAAIGIHRVANAQMAEGIRLVSVKQGVDPRNFALVPLGGGGGMHVAPLAEDLGMTRVLVPRYPGVLCAYGLLSAPIEHATSSAYGRELHTVTVEDVKEAFVDLDTKCDALMSGESIGDAPIERRYFADVCFVGQSYTLEVPIDFGGNDPLASLHEAFKEMHLRVYGHCAAGQVRLVNLRAVHRVMPPSLPLAKVATSGEDAGSTTRPIWLAGRAESVSARILQREAMPVGYSFEGPAIVEQADTTTLVLPNWKGHVDDAGNLLLHRQ
ncbi:hydantoinase/oxoprolinase family protein [Burkholderia multivorans]|uniref:hydantoinase/oxoprolinase family protein n=1 Tax=Burkholderia multivorans TaxID=87883 RepID=UPI001C2406AF|nr:hydantoinase/oxoprolinase family protein [Burkholderia multivorans]MBU9652763.1 hydantoinase/oxoprolinase family protein [Burkholderia multivorans]MDN7450867.1 hydantoinase/oxoprolinase family protein [Burkholderia multivorans]